MVTQMVVIMCCNNSTCDVPTYVVQMVCGMLTVEMEM